MEKFHHLATGLAVILAFIGVKMLLTDVWQMPIWLSLTVIAVVLTASIVWSLVTAPPSDGDKGGDDDGDGGELAGVAGISGVGVGVDVDGTSAVAGVSDGARTDASSEDQTTTVRVDRV